MGAAVGAQGDCACRTMIRSAENSNARTAASTITNLA